MLEAMLVLNVLTGGVLTLDNRGLTSIGFKESLPERKSMKGKQKILFSSNRSDKIKYV